MFLIAVVDPRCTYQEVWYYAIVVTGVLGDLEEVQEVQDELSGGCGSRNCRPWQTPIESY